MRQYILLEGNEKDISAAGYEHFKMIHASREVYKDDPTLDKNHIHDCYEIYINIKGNVSFLAEDTVHPISPGDIVIFKPNAYHHCVINEKTVHEWICIWLKAKDPSSILPPFLLSDYSARLTPFELSGMQELFCLCGKLAAAKDEFETLTFLFKAFYFIQTKYIVSLPQNIGMPSVLVEIVSEIKHNLKNIHSLNEITDAFYISSSSLNRYFNNYLGITPSKYIENLRISNACRLLAEGESVQAAFEESGFADYSHFIQIFKKRIGITPGRYRKVAK